MTGLSALLNRMRMWLRAVFTRRNEDRELAREMESHIAMERDSLIRQGVEPGEADRRARVAFGGVQRHTEAVRDERGTRFFDTLWQDVRYAFRQYARAPWVAATIIFTLSLGLGTSSWLFILTDYMSAHPLAGLATDRDLVRIRGLGSGPRNPSYSRNLAHRELEELAKHNDVFASVGGATQVAYIGMRPADGVAASIVAQFVTPGFLGTIGAKPEIGSLLPPDDDPGAPATVYVSHRVWRTALGKRTDVAGLKVYIGDVAATIVGVAPAGFKGVEGASESRIEAWLPLSAYAAVMHRRFDPTRFEFHAVASLRGGVTRARAEAVAKSVSSGAAQYSTRPQTTTTADVVPVLSTNLSPHHSDDLPIVFALLGTLSLIVLGIVCTNVSGLMLGRAAVRRREIGVRISLGATRSRLIRQLLTESTLLAFAGAALALLVLKGMLAYLNANIPDEPARISWLTVGLTALVALGTGAICGLSPALHAIRTSIADVIKGASGGRPHHTRTQRVLIVAQVALSQPLLVILGLTFASMVESERTRYFGDATERTIVMELETPQLRAAGRDSLAGARLSQEIVDYVSQIPGVEKAAMSGWSFSNHFKVVADARAGIEEINFDAQLRMLGPGYFALLGAPMVRGREFDKTDVIGGTPAAIITNDFAAQRFGKTDPIGQRIACPEGCFAREFTIVGVVDGEKVGDRRDDNRARFYTAVTQAPNFGGPTIHARVRGDGNTMIGVLRTRMGERFRDVPIERARTLAVIDADRRRENLLGVGATGGAGLVALLLAAVGLYGVVSLAVNQRMREIGVRVALGATQGGIVRHFFRDGVMLSVIGCAIGLPVSLFAVRYFSNLIGHTEVNAWVIGVAIAALVTGISMLATWWPARRAARIDPLVALRAE